MASKVVFEIPDVVSAGVKAWLEDAPYMPSTRLNIMYIDIIGFSRFEMSHGSNACDYATFALERALMKAAGDCGPLWPQCSLLHVWDDGYVVLLPTSRLERDDRTKMHRLVIQTECGMNQDLARLGYPGLSLRYGVRTMDYIPSDGPARVEAMVQAVTGAARTARRNTHMLPLSLVEALNRTIGQEQITVLYQPIIDLCTGNSEGMECLARGPAGSPVESPAALFDAAAQLNRLYELERICRAKAIRHAKLEPGQRLFLNISPDILLDPKFREGETRQLIQLMGWRPADVVFEITENQAIADYGLFKRSVDHYRQQGYSIALDDVGAGHSGLVTLLEVKPDFLKIDMALIRGIHTDRTKQDIVSAIVTISRGWGARTIAEGIETPEELHCVRQLGVTYGQGFLLGRPQPMSAVPQTWQESLA